ADRARPGAVSLGHGAVRRSDRARPVLRAAVRPILALQRDVPTVGIPNDDVPAGAARAVFQEAARAPRGGDAPGTSVERIAESAHHRLDLRHDALDLRAVLLPPLVALRRRDGLLGHVPV